MFVWTLASLKNKLDFDSITNFENCNYYTFKNKQINTLVPYPPRVMTSKTPKSVADKV